MKEVKVTIDTTTAEGRQIVEELKRFPDIVAFENGLPNLEEPTVTYKKVATLDKDKDRDISGKYIKSELFWNLIERKRKKFCTDNGVV